MRRRTSVLIALLFAVFWQSLAVAGVGSTVDLLSDLRHASLHIEGASHLHHDDGSYHLDDSSESVCHVMGDHFCCSAGLLPSGPMALARVEAPAPRVEEARAGPAPFLDGPLRPPRRQA